ncbi:DUF456 domain-containing protein [Bacteroidota bacterium]
MDILVLIIGFLLTVAGVIGCIIPALPGPPFNLVALILLQISFPDTFRGNMLIIFTSLTLIVTGLDYVLPLIGAEKFGVSKYGVIGSFTGMIVGLFFTPVGMILGLILGAVIGELAAGKKETEALKAGVISFMLGIFMMLLKFSLSVVMTYYFLQEVYNII